MLFNIVSYIKINFKLKIDPEICSFKNMEEILKIWKKIGKKRVATMCHVVTYIFFLYSNLILRDNNK